MRRGFGFVLIVIAILLTLMGGALAIQMVGHTDWWQVPAFAVLVLAVGFLLLRTGRRMRA